MYRVSEGKKRRAVRLESDDEGGEREAGAEAEAPPAPAPAVDADSSDDDGPVGNTR